MFYRITSLFKQLEREAWSGKEWLKNYSFQSTIKSWNKKWTVTNYGHSQRREILAAIVRVSHLQEHLQGPKNPIMSSLVLPKLSGEFRCDRRGNQLDCLSPLPKADSDSNGGSTNTAQKLPSDQRVGSIVRKIKQGVYFTLHKLRRRSTGDFALSGMRRVSVLELRFGSPTNTSHQGPSYPIAWHATGG